MTRARRKWYLVDNGDETFDVLMRGRPILVGVSRPRAIRFLRSKSVSTDQVFSTEPDGYQTRMPRLS